MINGDGKNGFKLTEGDSMAMARVMERFLEQEERSQ